MGNKNLTLCVLDMVNTGTKIVGGVVSRWGVMC
jgi:hypothetical protein